MYPCVIAARQLVAEQDCFLQQCYLLMKGFYAGSVSGSFRSKLCFAPGRPEQPRLCVIASALDRTTWRFW
jgi:hypothetical protein